MNGLGAGCEPKIAWRQPEGTPALQPIT